MAGLSLKVGGFGGVTNGGAPQYGSAASYQSGSNLGASAAAFGDGATPSFGAPPVQHATGIATYVGIGAILALCLLRYSLPN